MRQFIIELCVYDAHDTIEVSYMGQSESTRDPPLTLVHINDPHWQDQNFPLSDSRPPKPRLGNVCFTDRKPRLGNLCFTDKTIVHETAHKKEISFLQKG